MDILVGHFQDPEFVPGLAHFCGRLLTVEAGGGWSREGRIIYTYDL